MDAKGASTPGLLANINTTINEWLGVSDFRTKQASLDLLARRPRSLDGEELIRKLFDRLDLNWKAALGRPPHLRPSLENFRWCVPKLDISEKNQSREVKLERALISACCRANREDWANQIPLISGVFSSRAHKRRAVDLVHQLSDGGFEFVELKVSSGTPLYAAMEIVVYGLLWLLSRRDRERLDYKSNPILDASRLQLSVLAPAQFYSRFALPDLPTALDAGLSALGEERGLVGFRQMMFADGFQWPSNYEDDELLRFLDGRRVV